MKAEVVELMRYSDAILKWESILYVCKDWQSITGLEQSRMFKILNYQTASTLSKDSSISLQAAFSNFS